MTERYEADADDSAGHRKRDSILRFLFRDQLPLEQETVLFVFVNMLDVFMTYILLRLGGFRESNAVADFFIAGWGVKGMVGFKLGLVAFVCILAQIIALKKPASGRFVLNLGSLIVGGVVVYSVALLVRNFAN